MSQFEKAWKKFNRCPIPCDISFTELQYVAQHFGFETLNDGKHVKLRLKSLGIKIPIPIHGKTVQAVYIKQVKEAINKLSEE